MVRSRSGGQFDPHLVDAFIPDADEILAGPPARRRMGGGAAGSTRPHIARSTTAALDSLLVALGDFVDLKCPFTLGHSRAVAALAADAATAAGLEAETWR